MECGDILCLCVLVKYRSKHSPFQGTEAMVHMVLFCTHHGYKGTRQCPWGDKSPDPNKFEEESYEPPVDFKDPLFELMEGQEVEKETSEEAIISQLTPQERAEHQEIKYRHALQATGWSHNQH